MAAVGSLQPVSNRATWTESVQVYNDEDGQPFDISNATDIELQVRDPACCAAVLTATKSGGSIVLEPSTGVFTFTFSKDQMGSLCAKTYDVGCVATVNGETIQLVIGTLPVLEGVAR